MEYTTRMSHEIASKFPKEKDGAFSTANSLIRRGVSGEQAFSVAADLLRAGMPVNDVFHTVTREEKNGIVTETQGERTAPRSRRWRTVS